jgi:hypothetical protein
MAGRVYVLTYKGDPKKKLEKFKGIARTEDVFFEGDDSKGTFDGGPVVAGIRLRFKGSYVVKGKNIEVTILEKPILVSWELVEVTLKGFFLEE